MTDTSTQPAALLDDSARLSTAPEPPRPPAPGSGPGQRARAAWRQLTSMRTAIVLLFLLALGAVPGSLLPQRGLNPLAVETFYRNHPSLAPFLDHLSLFDVFAAPWFAAVYLLLFVSLIGCLVPRIRLHARALAGRPPAAPATLSRLRSHDSWTALAEPQLVIEAAAARLRARRFRVAVTAEGPDRHSLAAEKGYLRETGNLLFHLSLLGILVGVALGGLFGYKATVSVVAGSGFSNTVTAYDTFTPGRLFRDDRLAPFTVTVDGFSASYTATGEPISYRAPLTYTAAPGAAPRHYLLEVNHPLSVDGTKVYLVGHGYAPVLAVRNAAGRLIYNAPAVFLPQDANFDSIGVVKVPGDTPTQLGLDGYLFPTVATARTGTLASAFPAARSPVVALRVWRGDLGMSSGVPQSVYSLDTRRLHLTGQVVLKLGQTARLPGGGTVTFAALKQYGSFQVTHDPGRGTALVAAICLVLGLLLSLRVRRRRVWLRAALAGDGSPSGRTVVQIGGLARTDHDDFAEEFARLVQLLRPDRAARAPDADEE
jgi:cytochrome c biogenesis protein